MNKCRLTSLIRLSYLAPEIVGALLAGRHPIELTPTRLLPRSKYLPHDWKGTAPFPRLRRLNLTQNPDEMLHIRRLENGLERPCGRSGPMPRHLASLVGADAFVGALTRGSIRPATVKTENTASYQGGAWLTRQSSANRSARQIPYYQGKKQGIFGIMAQTPQEFLAGHAQLSGRDRLEILVASAP
jgi:hypothetical protein